MLSWRGCYRVWLQTDPTPVKKNVQIGRGQRERNTLTLSVIRALSLSQVALVGACLSNKSFPTRREHGCCDLWLVHQVAAAPPTKNQNSREGMVIVVVDDRHGDDKALYILNGSVYESARREHRRAYAVN
jgi:hypothetical protein